MDVAAPVVVSRPALRVGSRSAVRHAAGWFRREPAVALLGLAWLATWLLAESTGNPSVVLEGGGALTIGASLAALYLEARRSALIITPLSMQFAWFTVTAGVVAIVVGRWIANGDPFIMAGVVLGPQDLATGYLLTLLGNVALCAGLVTLRPLRPSRLLGEGTGLLGPQLLWLAGAVARLFPSLHSTFGNMVGLAAHGGTAALVYLALRRKSLHLGPRRFWLLLVAGTVLEVGLNSTSGSKLAIMSSFLPLAWLFLFEGDKRKWILPLFGGLAALYLFVVQPIVTLARAEIGHYGDATGARLLGAFDRGDWKKADQQDDQVQQFVNRTFDSAPVAYIVHEVELHGLLGGATLESLPYAFVPRIIWPGKPDFNSGHWFDAYVLSIDQAKSGNCLAQGIAGELYWNFGIPGVILGAFLLGLLLSAVWRMIGDDPTRSVLLMWGYFLLIFRGPEMTGVGEILVGATYQILFFSVLFLLVRSLAGKRLASRRWRTPLMTPLPKTSPTQGYR